MNVEIGTEAAQFPEKKNINGIFLGVQEEADRRGRIKAICVSAKRVVHLENWQVKEAEAPLPPLPSL